MSLFAEVNAELERQRIYFRGAPLPTFVKPHVMARDIEQAWASDVELVLRALESAGHRLLEDPSLRSLLGFRPEADDLLAIEPGYSRLAVVSRPDLVWEGTEPRLMEINADSPAMMTFTDRLEEIFLALDPCKSVAAAYGCGQRSRTKSMLDAMLECYRAAGGTRTDPTIAIVDWAGEPTAHELLHTAAEFERFGCPTVVCDPREMRLTQSGLEAKGRQIDLVQRRVLFPDFLAYAEELSPLVRAYREGKVCMVNSLRSFIVGNKITLALVSTKPGEFGLSDEVAARLRSTVPGTKLVTEELADTLIAEKDDWVLKGAFGASGKEIAIGRATDKREWAQRVAQSTRELTIAQRFMSVPTYRVPVVEGDNVDLRALYANWNPWMFAGKYAGAMTRVSNRLIVGITGGGGLLPCIST